MSQSLSQIYLHVVFSTKERKPWLRDKTLRNELHAYLSVVCNNHDSPSLMVGGVEDHVHVLCRQAKTITVANLIRELKRDSSKWLKTKASSLAGFYWQQGYGAFSLSPAHLDAVKIYIANQEEHHRQVTFQEEFRRICAKYLLEIDERYVWD